MSEGGRRLVVVLSGGVSSEREVSLETGRAVLAGIERKRWKPWPFVLEAGGSLSWLPLEYEDPRFEDLSEGSAQGVRRGLWEEALSAWRASRVEVCFLALHGEGGEDGALQGALEHAGLAFTGGAAAPSALCMDKIWSRAVAKELGLNLADGIALERIDWAQDPEGCTQGILRAVGQRAFVKPARGGSSVGLRRVENDEELRAAVNHAFTFGTRVLVERAFDGIEVSCGVLGNSEDASLEILEPVEIRPSRDGWFTYHEKYSSSGAHEFCPVESISRDVVEKIQFAAGKLHRGFQLDGISRSDFLVKEPGFVFLETNTIPGLTPRSLLPLEASEAGYTYAGLLDRLLDLALEREERSRAARS